MDSWKKEEAKRKAEEARKPQDVADAVAALVKVLPHLQKGINWVGGKSRYEKVRQALDVLAGMHFTTKKGK